MIGGRRDEGGTRGDENSKRRCIFLLRCRDRGEFFVGTSEGPRGVECSRLAN